MYVSYPSVKRAKPLVVLVSLLVLLLQVRFLRGQEPTPRASSAQPDDNIQTFLKCLLSPNKREMFSGTEEAFREKLAQLRELSKDDVDLVCQLVYFSAHAKDMREGMLPGVLFEQMGIADASLVKACLPLLESEDETIRKEAAGVLPRADVRPEGGVDFSPYESILREKKGSLPRGLIRYMYGRNARAAVVSVARVYATDVPTSEVATRAQGGIKESLDYFAARTEWWAHLYVAAVMEERPHLRTRELMNRLEKDTDPLVVEKMTKMKGNAGKSK